MLHGTRSKRSQWWRHTEREDVKETSVLLQALEGRGLRRLKQQQMTTGPEGAGEGPSLLAESTASRCVQLGGEARWAWVWMGKALQDGE